MSQGTGSNPLFVHAIVLFVVAACVLVVGIIGIVEAAKDIKVEGPKGGVVGSLQGIQKAQSDAASAKSDAASLTSGGGANAGAALSKIATGKRLADKGKQLGKFAALLPGILTCLVAAGIGASAFFVLQQKNWARYASFGALALVLLYGTWVLSARNAVLDAETGLPVNEFSLLWPIGLTVISILAGKFLWDLFVEKFDEPAPAAA